MALPYVQERRLEANRVHISGHSLHQPANGGLATGNDLLEIVCNLEPSRFSSARSTERARLYRQWRISMQPRFS
jgi:hypothetical protein